MAISPIEMISFVPKSQEASQIKNNEQQKPMNEQMAFANQFKDDIKKNSEQTVASTKSDNPEYRYDAKEGGKNSSYEQQKKKKKKDKTMESSTLLPEEQHSFDIKI